MIDEAANRTTATSRPRVLLVDDEPALLDALQRQLRRSFDVTTALDAAAGLRALEEHDGFPVVVSDMRMPGMDGATFLARVRTGWPDATRVLLTGYAAIDAAIAAVNDGEVFRFLLKPCDPPVLRAVLGDAVEQHRLRTAERELLEQTLRGSVAALLETLSLANPAAFARAGRVRALVEQVLDGVEVPDRWQVEVAAMLSQLGAVTLPPPVTDKLDRGQPLSPDERAMVRRVPEVAERLLAGIPRLDGVRTIIRLAAGPPAGEAVPAGAHILRVATAFDGLTARGLTRAEAIDVLERRAPWEGYDPTVLGRLRTALVDQRPAAAPVEVPVDRLEAGMVLEADVRTAGGVLLVGRGHRVTDSLLVRIRNFSARTALDRTVLVSVPQPER